MEGVVLDFRLFRECEGKFIARRGFEMIDCADDFERLIERLKRRGVDPREVLIDYVPEEPLFFLL